MDLVDLVPAQRRADLGAGPGPYRPRTEHRLMRGVLIEVDEHPLTAFFLPPGRGDKVRAPSFQLARDGDGRAADLDGVPARRQPDVDVQAAVPCRLRIAGDASLVQQAVQLG